MLFEKIAIQNNTTAEEVEKEISAALHAAGLDVDPEAAIKILAAIAKNKK